MSVEDKPQSAPIAQAPEPERKKYASSAKKKPVSQTSEDQVRIFCRTRPPAETKSVPEWLKLSDKTVELTNDGDQGTSRTNRTIQVNFDQVLKPTVSQDEVYGSCVKELVDKVIAGFPAVLLAYGQSGSGKTFTICGPHLAAEAEEPKMQLEESRGLVHKIADNLLEDNRVKEVTVTALEIYNKALYNASIPVEKRYELRHKIVTDSMIVDDLRPKIIRKSKQFADFFREVAINRRTNSQQLNDRSTRSHLIITFTVTAQTDDALYETISELKVIDLCGSERLDRSGATGEVAKETANINTGLFQLGHSINQLLDKQNQPNDPNLFVSTRNDFLTRSISRALRGESLIVFVFHIRGDTDENREETYDTLQFAARCKQVKIKVGIQKKQTYEQLQQELDLAEALIKELEAHNKDLREKLANHRPKTTTLNKQDASTQTLLPSISSPPPSSTQSVAAPSPSLPLLPPPPVPLLSRTAPPPPPSRSDSLHRDPANPQSSQSPQVPKPRGLNTTNAPSIDVDPAPKPRTLNTTNAPNIDVDPAPKPRTLNTINGLNLDVDPVAQAPKPSSTQISASSQTPKSRALKMTNGLNLDVDPVPRTQISIPGVESDPGRFTIPLEIRHPPSSISPGFLAPRNGRRLIDQKFNSLPVPFSQPRRQRLTSTEFDDNKLSTAQKELLVLFLELRQRHETLLSLVKMSAMTEKKKQE